MLLLSSKRAILIIGLVSKMLLTLGVKPIVCL